MADAILIILINYIQAQFGGKFAIINISIIIITDIIQTICQFLLLYIFRIMVQNSEYSYPSLAQTEAVRGYP